MDMTNTRTRDISFANDGHRDSAFKENARRIYTLLIVCPPVVVCLNVQGIISIEWRIGKNLTPLPLILFRDI